MGLIPYKLLGIARTQASAWGVDRKESLYHPPLGGNYPAVLQSDALLNRHAHTFQGRYGLGNKPSPPLRHRLPSKNGFDRIHSSPPKRQRTQYAPLTAHEQGTASHV